MRAVNEHGRGKDDGACNLVRQRSLAATFTENHRRVIGVPGQKARERQGRVMCGARLHAPVFETANRFTRHLVGPRARFTCGLVRPVKLDHDLVLRSFAQERLIDINYLFRLVVKEIYLRADDTDARKETEKISSHIGRPQVFTMFPEPETDLLLSGVFNKLAHLLFGPALPETFDHVVLKSQFASES